MTTALLHDHVLFVGESEADPGVEHQRVRSMLDRGVGGFLRYLVRHPRRRVVPALEASGW